VPAAAQIYAPVADWAWPHFAPVLEGKLPDALLVPGMKRGAAGDQHRQVCQRLGIADYELRDSRHSWAVRAAKAGTPAEIIARQLGHANGVMVLKVYGRFLPSQHDRDKWERIAALQDAAEAQAEAAVATSCATPAMGARVTPSGTRARRGPRRTMSPGGGPISMPSEAIQASSA
jgi:hypothetical protein